MLLSCTKARLLIFNGGCFIFGVVVFGAVLNVVLLYNYCKKNCNSHIVIISISSNRAVIARGMATEKQSKCY